jgi:hypothetical protein
MSSIEAEAAVCLCAKPKRLGFFTAGGDGGESGSVACSATFDAAMGFAGAIASTGGAGTGMFRVAAEGVTLLAAGLGGATFLAADFRGAERLVRSFGAVIRWGRRRRGRAG